jgi:pathogenesis-related protein 1
MKITIITSCIFLLVLAGHAQNVPSNTGSKVSQYDAQQALDFHNRARKDVGVKSLRWSTDLAKYAQQWAEYLVNSNNCNIQHRSSLGKETKDNTGENIFWGNGKLYNALHASQSWYNEIEDYSYRTITSRNFYATGHYTQMVWKNTKKVGIGIATCPDGATIIVANYSPAGNVIGRKPY